jgi:integrase
MTVKGFLNQWIKARCSDEERKGISKTTEQGYKIYIDKHINPILGDFLLSELKPRQIEAFYNQELKKYKAKTVLQEHRILHRAFKDAVKNGEMKRNVCDLVDAPSPEKPKLNIYTEDKFNLLIDAMQGTKWEVPILLAGMCGLRRGEVLGLKWSDIDTEKGTLSVKQTAVVANKEIIIKSPKSETSSRTIKIPDAILPVLKSKKGIGYVVTGGKGLLPMHGGTFSKRFAEFLALNNLEHIRFHDLRHFNATMMLKYGVSDVEAAYRLGHSDPSVTKRIYQHVLEEMDKEASGKLNNIYKTKQSNGVKNGVKA